MWEKIRKVLRFNGVFILIGVLGGLSSILTVFVGQFGIDINLKWLIAYIYISIVIYILLFKVVNDLVKEIKNHKKNLSLSVLSYNTAAETIIGEKADWITLDTFVTVYYKDNEFITEMGYGYVSNINDESIQIKLIRFAENFRANYREELRKLENNDISIINRMMIKTIVTYTKLDIYERDR